MMKTVICETIQRKISSGESLSPEEKCHADCCLDCGNFLAFCGKVLTLPQYEDRGIPAEAENAIRAEAFRNLIRRKHRSLFCRIGIPAAAAVFVCAFLIFSGTGGQVPAERQETVLRSAGTAWSSDYDEKLLAMTCEMDCVMEELDESLKTVSI